MVRRFFMLVLFGAVISVAPVVRAQKGSAENQRAKGVPEQYAGNWVCQTYMPLNPQLEHELLSSFSGHRFSIAEMRFIGHLPPSNYPLIVITDALSGEVVGFVRHLNWGVASKSFTNLFNKYHADNKEDLERKLLVLGALISFTDQRGSVGRVNRKKNVLSVDLLWPGVTWRKLQAEYDSAFQIRRMTLLNASKRRGFF